MEPMFYEGDIVGSTPLARGTPGKLRSTDPQSRFNPACAGNSPEWFYFRLYGPVQPRLRGELLYLILPSLLKVGSTPLARGTQCADFNEGKIWRFNPACAGNSGVIWGAADLLTVQPRLRGELSLAHWGSQ